MTTLEILEEEKGKYFPITKIREDWYTYALCRDKIGLNIYFYVYYLTNLDKLVIFKVAESTTKKPLSLAKIYTEPVPKKTIEEFMAFIEGINWQQKCTIQKVDDLRLSGLNLDTMLLLPPEEYDSRLFSNQELIAKTIEVFPIYHFEFSGSETPDEINYLKFHYLYTLDWKRKLSPKVLVHYNIGLNERIRGKKPVVVDYGNVRDYILISLENSLGFADVWNYLDEKIHIESKNKGLFIVGSQSFNLKELQQFVYDFLHK